MRNANGDGLGCTSPIGRYLHVTDTVDTASACGIAVRPRRADEPALKSLPTSAASGDTPFDRLIDSWFPLTYVLNNLNRALGLRDGYPFVLSAPAIEKMRFVHDTVGLDATADALAGEECATDVVGGVDALPRGRCRSSS